MAIVGARRVFAQRGFSIFAIVLSGVLSNICIIKANDYHPCVRTCVKNVTMFCHYKFTLENFVTMGSSIQLSIIGSSCEYCNPNGTRLQLSRMPDCQCVTGDGYERGVLTINRMLPGPSIQVCMGDTIIVDVVNSMEAMDTTIHWHGMHQRGSQYYDGVPFVTQCPIPGGNTFRYEFNADKAGTHFYHSHSGVQKLDGLYGSIVVRLPHEEDPHGGLYEHDIPEHTIVISDFLHTSSSERIPGFTGHDTGQYPETFLINGRGRFRDRKTNEETESPYEEITVKPNDRYRLRLINALGTSCDVRFTIENHAMTVVASDGDDLLPFVVDSLVFFAGERYDVIIETNKETRLYWIQVVSELCIDNEVHQLAVLRYTDGTTKELQSPKPTYFRSLPKGVIYQNTCESSSKVRCITDLRSRNRVDSVITKPIPDLTLYLPYQIYYYQGAEPFVPNTYKHFLVPKSARPVTGLIDGISFVFPHVPPLSQPEDIDLSTLCNSRENLPPQCTSKQNCICTHTVNLRLGDVVEIILVDYDEIPNVPLSHPFHLHGHSFYVTAFGQTPSKVKNNTRLMRPILGEHFRRLITGEIRSPPAKDTIAIPKNGYAILRVQLNNPGYWYFHCHFEYHSAVGMNMILHVGNRSDLPAKPPKFPKCGDFSGV